MSISHNNKRKAAKAKRSAYAKELVRKIRKGILPRFHLVVTGDGRLERSPANGNKRHGISLRQVGTIWDLTKDQYSAPSEAPVPTEEGSTNENTT